MKILLGFIWTVLIVGFMALATVGIVTEELLYIKLSMVLGGFLFYCILMMTFNKDDYDDSGKAFPIIEYAQKTWDNWILNWIGCILLLVAGQAIFGIINFLEGTELQWQDGYYVASGFIVNFIVDKVKERQKNKLKKSE